MKKYLHFCLITAGFAGTFAAGYLVRKPDSSRKPDADRDLIAISLNHQVKTTEDQLPKQLTPSHRDEADAMDLKVPQGKPTPISEIPVEKNDLAFKMIEKELGIKTTILDTPPSTNNPTKPQVLPEIVAIGQPPQINDGKILIERSSSPSIEVPSAPIFHQLPQIPQPQPAVSKPACPTVNDRKISLDFQITQLGLSAVKSVELWATRDEGKTWELYDRMNGNQTPFKTYLTSEGKYGFVMVFESEAGQRSTLPKTGTTPDVSVELDSTAPVVKLNSKLTPVGPQEMRISWDVSDKNPDHSKTDIEYSQDGKQWTTIQNVKPVGAIADSTQCAIWKLPSGISHEVLLRITVRDKAGNKTVAQTPTRTSIDLVPPTGKITRIVTNPDAHEIGPIPREVSRQQNFAASTLPTWFVK